MTISTSQIIDRKSNWQIKITDLTKRGTRFHANPNKLNYLKNSKLCNFGRCRNTIRSNRTSGLCDKHQIHQHSLFLELFDTTGNLVNAPLHIEIVDKLIEWAKPRNYDLISLFKDISFNILGNIPDVSSLAGETKHTGYTPPSLQNLLNEAIIIVDKHMPDYNNSSYQPLITKQGDIPARILALTFAGLILCEEANRGDRWFNRIIRKDESKTELLGGAMPIGYFAARMFPWGIEIGKAAQRFMPR
ncbi:MAG: hypothetical protein R2852_10010 [Bacteroidia bacterium]